MSKVTIRGAGHDTEILLDGVRVEKLRSFKLLGEGANEPTRLILDIKVDDAEVETDAEIIHASYSRRKPYP